MASGCFLLLLCDRRFCVWFSAPILSWSDLLPTAQELASAGVGVTVYLRSNMFRSVGIGMLIGDAMTGIFLALPRVLRAVKSMQTASKSNNELAGDEFVRMITPIS